MAPANAIVQIQAVELSCDKPAVEGVSGTHCVDDLRWERRHSQFFLRRKDEGAARAHAGDNDATAGCQFPGGLFHLRFSCKGQELFIAIAEQHLGSRDGLFESFNQLRVIALLLETEVNGTLHPYFLCHLYSPLHGFTGERTTQADSGCMQFGGFLDSGIIEMFGA